MRVIYSLDAPSQNVGTPETSMQAFQTGERSTQMFQTAERSTQTKATPELRPDIFLSLTLSMWATIIAVGLQGDKGSAAV